MLSAFRHMRLHGQIVRKCLVPLFFLVALATGLKVYDNYGISTDEHASRLRGFLSALYANQKAGYLIYPKEKVVSLLEKTSKGNPEKKYSERSILTHQSRGHGALFDMALLAPEILFSLEEDSEIYKMRHLVTFLYYWLGLICFYGFLRKVNLSWYLSLLGVALLFLSPRIFSNSFYNMKDIAFLTSYIIAAYTSLHFIQKKSVLWALIHAVACAVSIAIRVPGLILPFITFAVYLYSLLSGKKVIRQSRVLISLGLYLIGVTCLTIAFWPFLWESPWENFRFAFAKLGDFPAKVSMYFMGDIIQSTNLPWYYLPTWIGITTPLPLLIFFLVGTYHILVAISRHKIGEWKQVVLLSVLSFFLLPLLVVITKSSVLYNGWRHMYFIYPFLVTITTLGIRNLLNWAQSKSPVVLMTLRTALFLVFFGLIKNLYQLHPYQHSYFNLLAGQNIAHRFDTDYWGLSFKQGFEYLLSSNEEDQIKVHVPLVSLQNFADILTPTDRERLKFVPFNEATFLLVGRGGFYAENFLKQYDLTNASEVYCLSPNGVKILSIYQIK